MENNFTQVYDEIDAVQSSIEQYAIQQLLSPNVPSETKERIRKVRDAMSALKDVAHELNEHLAWD